MRFVLSLAFKHIFSRISQSLLIILAVALGVLVIVFIPAINDGFYNELLNKTINTSPHIQVTRYDDITDMTSLKVVDKKWTLNRDKTTLKTRRLQAYRQVLSELDGINGVVAYSPYVNNNASLISGDKNLNVIYNGILYPEQQEVVDINKDLIFGGFNKLNPNGIVVSQKIADKLRVDLLDSITISSSHASKNLKIVGIYSSGFISKDETTVYISLNTAQNLSGIGNQVDGIGVKVKDPWHIEGVATDITYKTGLESKTWKDDNESLLAEIASFAYVMFLINATIMLAIAAGVLGIMIILINSKQKQIGMLKALGVTSSGVIKIFVFEGFILSLMGAALGSLLATLLMLFYNAYPIPISENYGVSEIKCIFKLSIYMQGVILAVVCGCLAAFIPAYFASKIEPAEVLKST